jgi:hypothetical protein
MKQLNLIVFIICIAILPLVISCENYRYEIENVSVDAKILGVTNECIGIQYEMGGELILADICDLKISQISYITSNSKDNTVKLAVKVVGTDVNHVNGKVYFHYYLGGEKIGEGEGEMEYLAFANEVSNHPNFVWKTYNGVINGKPSEDKEKAAEKLVEVDSSESKDKNALPTLQVK